MLMISISGYYNPQNDFLVKEIYVSDDREVYIMKGSESFLPHAYPGTTQEVFDSIKNCYYPVFSMSKVKTHPDNDAKSLATFLMGKIHALDMNKKNAHKTLFDVISSFGGEDA
jgi:hypothetical protein